MISNKRILAEILARKYAALLKIKAIDLMPEYQDVMEHLGRQDDALLISLMCEQLVPNFSRSQDVQFQGFEWYYDGSDYPHIIGYYGSQCSIKKFNDGLPVGSDTWEYRQDFESGIKPEKFLSTDSGYVDMHLVTKPLYDVICEEGEGYSVREVEDEDEYEVRQEMEELLESVYSLKLFEILHKSMVSLVENKASAIVNAKKPFYVFANNHDTSPFLIYIIE